MKMFKSISAFILSALFLQGGSAHQMQRKVRLLMQIFSSNRTL